MEESGCLCFFCFFCFFSEVFDIYCFEQDAVRMKSQPAYQKYSETSIEVVGYCCSENVLLYFRHMQVVLFRLVIYVCL